MKHSRNASHPTRFFMRALFATGIAASAAVQAAPANHWGADTLLNRECVLCNSISGRLAVDAGNSALAIWTQNAGVAAIAASRLQLDTNQWSRPQTLYAGARHAQNPEIALNAAGTGIAAWTELGSNTVYAGTWQPGGAFSAAGAIHSGVIDARTIRVAIDGDGNAIVIWVQSNGIDPANGNSPITQVMAKRFSQRTQTWSAALPVSSSVSGQNSAWAPSLGIDAYGNAMVVWTGGNQRTVHAAHFVRATGQWSSVADVNGDAADYLAAAFDRFGNASAFWRNPAGQIVTARYRANKGWSAPRVIQAGSGPAYFPHAAADGAGNVIVVWTQQLGSYEKTVSARYSATTGQWSAPVALQVGDHHGAAPSVAADAAGNAVAVWTQRTDTRVTPLASDISKVTAARFSPASGAWSVPSTVQSSEVRSALPHVAIDATGRALVVWEQDSGAFWNGIPIVNVRVNRELGQ